MQKKEGKFDTKFVHLQGRAQFALNASENEIITVGNDALLKIVDIGSRSDKVSVDLDEEYYAISINEVNCDIAIGGNQNVVKIYDSKVFEKEINSFKFEYKILKLCYSHDGNSLGVLLENSQLSIINLQTNKIFQACNKQQQLGINFNFSANDKAISEMSSNGTLRIYSLQNLSKIDEDELGLQFEGECIRDVEEPLRQFEFNELCEMSWKLSDKNNEEQILGLPGATVFQYLEYSQLDNQFSIKQNNSIFHSQQIICILWLPENALLTFSKDLSLRIWNYESCEKLYEISIVNCVWGIAFNEIRKELVYLDEGGFLGFWQLGELKGRRKKLVVEEEDEEDRRRVILDEMSKNTNKQQQEEEKIQQEEQVEEVQKEQKLSVNKYDQLIDFRPQDILYSSSTQYSKGRRFLKQNLTGCIIGRKENQLNYIDVEFADKQFHRNIIIINNYQLSIGDMNQSGVILASRGSEINEDEYEDENERDETKFSHIVFKPFNFFHEKDEWHYQLPENERAECVCIGGNWCAVSTDLHIIRVFNLAGFDLSCFSFDKPLVCMAGYENQLAYVCHDGVPILGCQSFKLTIVDVDKRKTIMQTSLPVSPYSLLTWLEYSEEGLLLAQDSTGMIRGLFNEGWVVLFDDSKEKQKFWLIGMLNYNFIGVNLGKDEFEPLVVPRPFNTQQTIRLPYLNTNQKYKEIAMDQLIHSHEKQRFEQWRELKGRERMEPGFRNVESILNEAELVNEGEKIERKMVNLFRELILANELEKAVILVESLVKSEKGVVVCIRLCEKLGLGFMVKQLNQILTEQSVLISTQKTIQPDIPSQFSAYETNKQLPKKFGLSKYAVNKTQALTTEDIKNISKKRDKISEQQVQEDNNVNEIHNNKNQDDQEIDSEKNDEMPQEKQDNVADKNPFAMKQMKTTPIKQLNFFDSLGANTQKPDTGSKKRLSNIMDEQKFTQLKKDLF